MEVHVQAAELGRVGVDKTSRGGRAIAFTRSRVLGFALEVHGVVIIVHGVGVLALGLALLGALVLEKVVVVRVNHELRVALLTRGSLGMWCMPKVGTLADEVSAATVVAFPGVALAEASVTVYGSRGSFGFSPGTTCFLGHLFGKLFSLMCFLELRLLSRVEMGRSRTGVLRLGLVVPVPGSLVFGSPVLVPILIPPLDTGIVIMPWIRSRARFLFLNM